MKKLILLLLALLIIPLVNAQIAIQSFASEGVKIPILIFPPPPLISAK